MGAIAAARVPVDRASPADLMQFAADVGPAPMHVGAVLILGGGPGFSVQEAQRLLGERVRAVPRLRQRLHRAPPGCGRPFWADDPAFDLRRHVRQLPCPAPGDERALLDVAAAVTGGPLPRSRPLWSATFVTGLADGGTGLVIVMNHVLADGIGGLAVLARLVDPVPGLPPAGPQAAPFPAPGPRVRALAADAWAGRAHSLTRLAGSLRRIRQGFAELGGTRLPRRPPPTTLNRPTGPRRRLDVVAADLAAIRDLGHAHGGTVNDVILAAVAGALRALLASRGEELDLVVASVPVSARQAATGGQLGNQVGVMPVALPTGGDLATRVTQIAAITRERKTAARGTSAAVLGLPFRLLVHTGLLRWFINRQRLIHTFVTDLRGPAGPLSFAGAPVRAVIAMWPWLVQVGFGRAGFYSNDLLDNFARPSLREIDPDLQKLDTGQWVSMSPTPSESTAWKVDSFAQNEWLLWRKPDSTWSWVLRDLGNGRTRLITRVHVLYDWSRPGYSAFGVVLMEFGDFAMMRRMLLGIKERAETTEGAAVQ